MSQPTRQSASPTWGLLAGAALVVVGAGLLIARYVDIDLGEAWPLLIIFVGLALATVGITTNGTGGTVLTGIGSLVTGEGVALAVLNATDHWEDWAYVWPLSALGAVGVGLMVRGSVRREPPLVTLGTRLAVAGAILFVVLYLLFERNGLGWFGGVVIPVILVVAGVFQVARTVGRR